MNLADYLRRQFAYDEWANKEVFAALRASGNASQRSLQLMAHLPVGGTHMAGAAEATATELLGVARNWAWRSVKRKRPRWPACGASILDPDHCQLDESVGVLQNQQRWWSGTIVDILSHVVLHSAYHRGQIASHMRESGQTPAYTDFIHGVRQGLVT